MNLDDASDLLMSVSSALTCCLEMTSSELSDVCCASAPRPLRACIDANLHQESAAVAEDQQGLMETTDGNRGYM